MSPACKITVGIMCVLAGLCLCPVGAVQLMAEGPHGPNGEIMGATGGTARFFICLLGFGVMLALGVVLIVRGLRERP